VSACTSAPTGSIRQQRIDCPSPLLQKAQTRNEISYVPATTCRHPSRDACVRKTGSPASPELPRAPAARAQPASKRHWRCHAKQPSAASTGAARGVTRSPWTAPASAAAPTHTPSLSHHTARCPCLTACSTLPPALCRPALQPVTAQRCRTAAATPEAQAPTCAQRHSFCLMHAVPNYVAQWEVNQGCRSCAHVGAASRASRLLQTRCIPTYP